LDTITHGLIGALASRSGFYQRTGMVSTVAFTVGAVFPDVDILASLLGPDLTLRYHRGMTHSVVATPIFALFLAALIYRFSSFKNLRTLTLMVAIGIYSHIFFDLITSYGTVVFDPISVKRYSWNLVFILDPFVTIPVLVGVILCRKKKEAALRVSSAVFLFLALYLLFCFYCRELNSERVNGFAKVHSLDVLRSSVYPRPLGPFFWMGVVETGDAFYRVNLSLFKNDPDGFYRISKSKDNRFIELAKGLKVTKLYLWFADFPVAEYKNENGRHIVEFFDLRFGVVPHRVPFLLKVVFNGDGSLESVSLNGMSVRDRF
jgi:inner membrane protein